jgi:hypothetical protein
MFISTPFVRFVVNRLYCQGRLDDQQRERLVSQDININIIITIVGGAYMAASYL